MGEDPLAVAQRNYGQYLINLKASDPFQYQFLYGDSSPYNVVHGQYGAGALFGSSAAAGMQDYTQALADARAKYGNDITRLQNDNPIAADTGASAAASAGTEGYSGPSAREKLNALLPSGFDQSAIGSTFTQPFVEQKLGAGRTSAQDFIGRMLARGTLTPQGASQATDVLGGQEAGVRGKLTDLSNSLLEGERAKLRGIFNEGASAADVTSGASFDPTPYKTRIDQELARFQSDFPNAFGSAAGDPSALYSTAGFSDLPGAVTGPGNIVNEPYAPSTGAKAGTEEEPVPEDQKKKRTTAVF